MGIENNIPEGWMETTLGQVALIGSSKRIFFSEYVNKGIPFYRSKEIIQKQKGNNISTELFITEEKYDNLKKNFGAPKENDILLTSVGTLGIPYRVRKNEIFYFKDGNLTWFRDYQNIESAFLYNWFLSSTGKHQLNKITIGSTQSALTISGLKSIEILLPPINEQIEITNIINAFDDKIELLQVQNKTLETMAQTIFKEWFGKYQIGDELPEGWRVGKLAEEFDILMGQSPKGSSYNENGEGTIFFQGRTDFNTRFPTIRQYTSEPKRIADPLDVLVSVRAPVGDINIASHKCCIGRGLSAVKSINKSYCLYKLLCLKPIFELFESEGTVFGSINKNSFSNIEVVIPDIELIKKFEEKASKIDLKILNNSKQIQSLSKTRDTLLPKLMSGQVRANNLKQTADA